MNLHTSFVLLAISATLAACGAATVDPQPPEQGRGAATATIVHAFDAAAFELPEGLVVRDGRAYVGLAPLGRILETGSDGATRTYATIPPGGRDGYLTGLVFDAAGNLYAAATRNRPDASATMPGIYKIPPGGGAVTKLFASAPKMTFPNGLAFDDGGRLYVTDSAVGIVFRVAADGATEEWAKGAALEGSVACRSDLPFPMGANGIVFARGAAYVLNTSKGSLVKIPVLPDGRAGEPSAVFEDCGYVGLDGIARDTADGTLYVAQNGLPGRVFSWSEGLGVRPLFDGAPLDGPASLEVGVFGGDKRLLVTSAAFFSSASPAGGARPSLTSIRLP
ncbi:MAG: SMP-30/gluconolactonase/LRE family protein [Polyangiaceae bacterium]